MRHKHKIKQLSREMNQRNALLKTLAVSLIKHGQIETTEVKAKALKPLAERLVTFGKTGTLAGQRNLISRVGPTAATKMMKDIAPKYKDRQGGYTRIVKTRVRKTDAASMAVISFV